MLTVKVGLGSVGNKKLAPVRAWPGIGHRDYPGFMRQGITLEFILKTIAWTPSTTAGRVSALDHEVANDPVEGDPIIEAFTGQEDKVVDGLGSILRGKLQLNCTPICFYYRCVLFFGINFNRRWISPLFICRN